jgi:hypothetical protein
MLKRTETQLVTYRGGDSSRLEATVNEGSGIVALSLQTVETSAAFSVSRASLEELCAFLSEVIADLPPVAEPETIDAAEEPPVEGDPLGVL